MFSRYMYAYSQCMHYHTAGRFGEFDKFSMIRETKTIQSIIYN